MLEEDWWCEISYFADQTMPSLLLLSHTNSFVINHSMSTLMVARIHFSITYALFSYNTLFFILCDYFCLCNLSRVLCSTSVTAVCNTSTTFTHTHIFLFTDLFENIIWTLNKTLKDMFPREKGWKPLNGDANKNLDPQLEEQLRLELHTVCIWWEN